MAELPLNLPVSARGLIVRQAGGHMMRPLIFGACLALAALLPSARAMALSNVARDTTYVRILRMGPDARGFDEALDSLTYNRVVLGEPWCGDQESNPWTHCHHNIVSPAVVAIARDLIKTEWGSTDEHRRRLLELTASHAGRWLDTLDVFQNLTQDDSRLPYQSLAILRDRRSAAVLMARFHGIRHHPEREAYPGEVMDVVRCLYHVPWYTLDSARAMHAEETDPAIREVLARAIAANSPTVSPIQWLWRFGVH